MYSIKNEDCSQTIHKVLNKLPQVKLHVENLDESSKEISKELILCQKCETIAIEPYVLGDSEIFCKLCLNK